jgi:hypothetical protein
MKLISSRDFSLGISVALIIPNTKGMIMKTKSTNPLKTSIMIISSLILFGSGIYNTYVIGFNVSNEDFSNPFFSSRNVANAVQPAAPVVAQKVVQKSKTVVTDKVVVGSSAPQVANNEPVEIESLIKEDIDLSLGEAFDPKSNNKVLGADEVDGHIAVSGGVIDELSATFPNGKEVNISYAKIKGNMFQFDVDGMTQAGVIYQVEGTYMVTFSTGEYQGVRLKFGKSTAADQNKVAAANSTEWQKDGSEGARSTASDEDNAGHEF